MTSKKIDDFGGWKVKPRFFVLMAILIGLLVYIISTIIIHYSPDSLVTSRYWEVVFSG